MRFQQCQRPVHSDSLHQVCSHCRLYTSYLVYTRYTYMSEWSRTLGGVECTTVDDCADIGVLERFWSSNRPSIYIYIFMYINIFYPS